MCGCRASRQYHGPVRGWAANHSQALCRARVGVVVQPQTRGAWYRCLRLVAFEGSTLDVPDEAENRQEFGLPGAGRGQAAFAQVRLTAVVEVGTRVAFAWHRGALRESEAEQAEALLGHLSAGMLVLADRYYFGFPLWLRATQTGAELLWRVKANTRLPVLERHADGSFRSIVRGSGRDRRRSQGECSIRVVEYRIDGEEDEVFRLATTLLDPHQAPATELAALYHERWESENAYDELKTHLLGPGALLRSKTPELVRQEVDGLMLAYYYVVRRLIHPAARQADEDPDRLSFVHAVRVIRRRIQNAGTFPSEDRGRRLTRLLLDEILEERVVSQSRTTETPWRLTQDEPLPHPFARSSIHGQTFLDPTFRVRLTTKATLLRLRRTAFLVSR